MRSPHTNAIRCLLGALALGGVLSGSARADLRSVLNGQDIDGSRLEVRSPDGYICRFDDSERPSLSIGAGLAASPVIPGYGNADNFSEGRIGDPQPVAGIALRIPLGAAPSNCNKIIAVETATMKVRRAQELYDLGLITIEQFEDIGEKAYAVINSD